MSQYVFPKVELPKARYSNQDLEREIVTTFAPCVVIPVLGEDVLPGDRWSIAVRAGLESFPTVAPVIGKWKAQFDFYFEPLSNLYGFMDNNDRYDTETWFNRKLHTLSLPLLNSRNYQDLDWEERQQVRVAPACLPNFLGYPAGYVGYPSAGEPTMTSGEWVSEELCAEYYLSVLDVVRNYYVNNQEQYAVYCKGDFNTWEVKDPDGDPYARVDLKLLDKLFKSLRMAEDGFNIVDNKLNPDEPSTNWPTGTDLNVPAFVHDHLLCSDRPLGGLFLRTYKMDLMRGVLNKDIGNFSSKVTVDEEGSFTIDTLRFRNKLQKLIDRFDLSGGRFSDWLRTVWRVKTRKNLDVPEYLGSTSCMINMRDVISTSAAVNAEGAGGLAQQAGYLGAGMSGRKISFKSDQYGVLLCMFSLTPYIVYSQGFELPKLKKTFADRFYPDMADLGYQDVLRKEMTAFPDVTYVDQAPVVSVGSENLLVAKRIAWSEYMACLPRAYGDFAFGGELDYWVLNRYYSIEEATGQTKGTYDLTFDSTTYMYPQLFNYLFVDQGVDSRNFRMHAVFDIWCSREIPKRTMPKL